MEPKTRNQSLLQEFLQAVEQVPTDIVSALLKVTVDEDHKTVINSASPTLTNQFKELSLLITELSGKASKQTLSEVERFLRVSSGVSLTKSLKDALPSISSTVGILSIDGILKEIKKILLIIFIIFDPAALIWLIPLLVLIDELWADLFGGGSIKLKTALSQAEQNFLAELTHMTRLQKAQTRGVESNEEEE
jgi:hypothetical protein